MPNRDYHQERRQYEFTELSREQLAESPFFQFTDWMDQAMQSKITDPTAMSVATVDTDGQPHSRIVLLKQSDHNGYVFYTHYDSDKGQQIESNAKAALLFFWPEMDRQIRIEGELIKIDKQQSEEYFQSRPRDSQIAAASSVQSSVVKSREILENNYRNYEQKVGEETIHCPEHWGGYRLKPKRFEFWQGRPNRLHDRFVYKLDTETNSWQIERLAP